MTARKLRLAISMSMVAGASVYVIGERIGPLRGWTGVVSVFGIMALMQLWEWFWLRMLKVTE